jgi:hypothetical protein
MKDESLRVFEQVLLHLSAFILYALR